MGGVGQKPIPDGQCKHAQKIAQVFCHALCRLILLQLLNLGSKKGVVTLLGQSIQQNFQILSLNLESSKQISICVVLKILFKGNF